jgi:hypothetical protein
VLLRWGWVSPEISGTGCPLTQNGAWISVDWTSRPVDPTAVEQLAEDAKARHIHYLFPFATYVRSDGTFSPSYDHAAEFVSQFRSFNQETRLLAWIGIPLRNDGGLGIEGWVDLSGAETRQEIISFVVDLLDGARFDGVHLNAETVINGNPDYLLLLDETKSAIGPSRILSIAGNDWKPFVLSSVPFVGSHKWSDAYYRSIVERVDQVATMTYDSFAPLPALYRLWLRQQIRGISRTLEHSDVELLIGVSISRERTLTHRPNAENMSNGLAGICAAVAVPSKLGHRPQGVALYAAWEADVTDWQIWDTWLAPSTGAEQ